MSEKRNGFIRFDNIDEFENYIKNLKNVIKSLTIVDILYFSSI